MDIHNLYYTKLRDKSMTDLVKQQDYRCIPYANVV